MGRSGWRGSTSSGTAGSRSAHLSTAPHLEEPLETQPWPAFRLDNLLALGRALHGIFQPSPSLLAFTVPSSIDLKKNPNPCFAF